MDKRDPVVMQAIANVIGTRTMDAGCLGPPPGQTQAIYDEIKRLDRVRLEAEHWRAAEIKPLGSIRMVLVDFCEGQPVR
jgi:hypothetical protein